MTTGEGGMITTNHKKLAEKIALIRNHGQQSIGQYEHIILGYNYRMTDLEASIGIEQLKKLDFLNLKRRENAKYLTESLNNVKSIILPIEKSHTFHVFHQYTIRVLNGKRDFLKKKLEEKGIQTKIFYPTPIRKIKLYKKLGYIDHLPEAEKASKEVLSLPVYPSLKIKELDHITKSIKMIMK